MHFWKRIFTGAPSDLAEPVARTMYEHRIGEQLPRRQFFAANVLSSAASFLNRDDHYNDTFDAIQAARQAGHGVVWLFNTGGPDHLPVFFINRLAFEFEALDDHYSVRSPTGLLGKGPEGLIRQIRQAAESRALGRSGRTQTLLLQLPEADGTYFLDYEDQIKDDLDVLIRDLSTLSVAKGSVLVVALTISEHTTNTAVRPWLETIRTASEVAFPNVTFCLLPEPGPIVSGHITGWAQRIADLIGRSDQIGQDEIGIVSTLTTHAKLKKMVVRDQDLIDVAEAALSVAQVLRQNMEDFPR